MRKKITLPIFLFFYLVISVVGQSTKEKYGNSTFYIVDSLDLNAITVGEKGMIDSCLYLYHKALNDTTKIQIIEEIIGNSRNDKVWIKYNEWIYAFIKEKLNNLSLNASNANFVNYLMKSQAKSLGNKGYYYYSRNYYSKALDYYDESLAIRKRLNDESGIASCFNSKALVYHSQGKFVEAVECLNKSLAIEEKLGDKVKIAFVYNGLGVIYNKQGKIKLAVEYLKNSLKIEEELGNQNKVALALINIANIFKEQGNDSLAIQYLKRSEEIYETLSYKPRVSKESKVYSSLGMLYREQNKSNLAEKYFRKSLDFEKKMNNKIGIANSYNNLALVLLDKGEKIKAQKYLEKGLDIYQEYGSVENEILSYNYLAELFLIKRDYLSAKKNAEKGLKLAYELGSPSNIQKNAKILSSIAYKQNNYKEAFEMYQLEIKMRDSILNEENYRVTIEQQTEYEYEKKKAADSIKNAVADKIKSAQLREVKLENEKNSLEVEAQKRQKLYSYLGLFFVIIFSGVIFNRFRASQKQKAIIQKQKEATESQKKQIEKQHQELEETHKEISDSIKYSERLQKAIFPSEKDLKSYLRDHFILFQPKDTVSGDFYWLQKVGEYTFFAVGDCTGHGVPGAMVSVVCSNALNRSIKEFDLRSTAEILDRTRKLVIETFSQSGKDIRDGMDIALFSFREGDNFVMYSGANNPLWITRKTKYLTETQKFARNTILGGEYSMIEYKANKQPIGLYENMKPFNQTRIDLFKNDTLYLFTDGFADQFGGEKGKKFKYQPFKNLLLSNNQLEMEKQRQKIFDSYINWKGNMEQVDDICIVGIKI